MRLYEFIICCFSLFFFVHNYIVVAIFCACLCVRIEIKTKTKTHTRTYVLGAQAKTNKQTNKQTNKKGKQNQRSSELVNLVIDQVSEAKSTIRNKKDVERERANNPKPMKKEKKK